MGWDTAKNIGRVLGYDANRTWTDWAKAWVPGSNQSKSGWVSARAAFTSLGALFSSIPPNQAPSPLVRLVADRAASVGNPMHNGSVRISCSSYEDSSRNVSRVATSAIVLSASILDASVKNLEDLVSASATATGLDIGSYPPIITADNAEDAVDACAAALNKNNPNVSIEDFKKAILSSFQNAYNRAKQETSEVIESILEASKASVTKATSDEYVKSLGKDSSQKLNRQDVSKAVEDEAIIQFLFLCRTFKKVDKAIQESIDSAEDAAKDALKDHEPDVHTKSVVDAAKAAAMAVVHSSLDSINVWIFSGLSDAKYDRNFSSELVIRIKAAADNAATVAIQAALATPLSLAAASAAALYKECQEEIERTIDSAVNERIWLRKMLTYSLEETPNPEKSALETAARESAKANLREKFNGKIQQALRMAKLCSNDHSYNSQLNICREAINTGAYSAYNSQLNICREAIKTGAYSAVQEAFAKDNK